jgi:hypothetical protein
LSKNKIGTIRDGSKSIGDEQNTVIAKTAILKKPDLSNYLGVYDLPDNFDFDSFDEADRDNRNLIGNSILLGIISFVSVWIFISWSSYDFHVTLWSGAGFDVPSFCFALIAGVLITFLIRATCTTEFHSLFLPYRNEVSRYRSDLAKYKVDFANWQKTSTELGVLFWQNQRGIEFERAVHNLLSRRNCKVNLTSQTGDGGVDLILYFESVTLFCQCKGLAKPVSVAPVREIAGVCSRSHATPVILAVNGYTRAARETAEQLGVLCLDAADLCRLAYQTHINEKTFLECGSTSS